MTEGGDATFCGCERVRKKEPKKVKKGVDKGVEVWYISEALERARASRSTKSDFEDSEKSS